MRVTAFTLLLCAGTTAFCQSAAPRPTTPDRPWQAQPAQTQPWTDFSKLPPAWYKAKDAPLPILTLPNADVPRKIENARIDPRMIIHPPPSRIGVQAPGKLVAQNEFPNLEMLPIQLPTVKSQPIPTQWPLLKIQAIPILWPKLAVRPVDRENPVTAPAPAK